MLHYTTRCNKTIIVWKCRHWEITINNKRISSVSTLKIFVFQQIRLLSMTTLQIPSVLTTETAYELEGDYHHVNVMHYCRGFVPSYITAVFILCSSQPKSDWCEFIRPWLGTGWRLKAPLCFHLIIIIIIFLHPASVFTPACCTPVHPEWGKHATVHWSHISANVMKCAFSFKIW